MNTVSRSLILLACGLSALAVAAGEPVSPRQEAAGNAPRDMSESAIFFAVEMHRRIAEKERGNFVFSPLGIHLVLAMIGEGARGTTAEQMRSVLQVPVRPQGTAGGVSDHFNKMLKAVRATDSVREYEIKVVNSLWLQRGCSLRKEYLEVIRTSYGGDLRPVDFAEQPRQACEAVNAWVKKETGGLISALLEESRVKTSLKMILANAAYFKGTWQWPFDKDDTTPGRFDLSREEHVKAPIMYQEDGIMQMGTDELQIGRRFYQDSRLSMIILLPRTVDGVRKMEENLSARRIISWLAELTRPWDERTSDPQIEKRIRAEAQRGAMSEDGVEDLRRELYGRKPQLADLWMPRFKCSRRHELTQALRALGMTDAFGGDKADFSGMDGTKGLFLGFVAHESVIEVDEVGTVAAAATGAGGLLGVKPAFRATHPFLFLIRHESTGAVLFMGRVADPTK